MHLSWCPQTALLTLQRLSINAKTESKLNYDNDNAPAGALRFLSVCSGIEAASVAWKPLGWKAVAFSEIEPAPCSVLKHHYPDTPNLGDMTKFKEWPDYGKNGDQPIDLLCGGTPCQSFSVAGLRSGLADPRGNLALTFLAIAERYQPRWIFWENVPGVLSSTSHVSPDIREPEVPVDLGCDGQEVDTEDEYDAEEVHAFNSFLAGLSELGYGWAYVVRDAQYVRVDGFARAVPQRRRRVFVVGYLGDWRRAAAVLLEPESMCGNPPPRRQAGQKPAPTLSARTQGGGGLGTDFELDGGLIAKQADFVCATCGEENAATWWPTCEWCGHEHSDDVAHPLLAKGNSSHDDSKETYVPVAFGGGNTSEIDVATTLTTKNQRIDFEAETFVATREVAATLTRGSENENGKGGYAGRRQEDDVNLVAHSLTANGFDASEDGTGRGTPIVPVPYTLAIRGRGDSHNLEWRQDGTANAILTPNGGRAGIGVGAIAAPVNHIEFEAAGTMKACKDSGGWSNSIDHAAADYMVPQTHAIQAGATRTNPNSGPDGVGVQADVAYTLEARAEVQAVQQEWAVRRLTPVECARLQGFPDGYLSVVMHNGKPLADGPMYKALGNSWPVNSVRWIGRRIQLVEEVAAELASHTPANDNNKEAARAA
ncbi:DNA cytosine methyltransferase [Pseudaminobacter sp. NGMCC 1.201702]|uniref:DNA cytosine methyltransferase n=1 Tax=Pseudaminobacter sp. NGMCC 1.201702 TaxID=3391825 RepID=UPI0039EE4B81